MKIPPLSFFEPFRTIWKTLQLWWDAWLALWLFGLVLVVCWATILLGPPATFGFFYAVRGLLEEDEETDGKEMHWRTYYQAARTYFWESWLWMLANLFVLFLVYSNLVFYSNLGGNLAGMMQILVGVVGVLWLAIQGYALPYHVLLEKKSLRVAWKNGLFTILAAPIYSLVVFLTLGVIIVLHIFVMPVFLAAPGFIILLASTAVEDRIQKFAVREQDGVKKPSP